jgi:hypothetical protein
MIYVCTLFWGLGGAQVRSGKSGKAKAIGEETGNRYRVGEEDGRGRRSAR